MFATTAFWALFWSEVITTFWTSLGGPIDYHLPYPTRLSYLGEHLIAWLAFLFIAEFCLRQMKLSPFSTSFDSLKTALPSYAAIGLFAEVAASFLVWHVQSTSSGGVTVWFDPTHPNHVLRSFLIERLTTWVVVFPLAFFAAYAFEGRQKALNRDQFAD
jgi:hypothetical protein